MNMTAAPSAGSHTAFLYLEDDVFLSWEALLSWAADWEPLAALGLTLGFARVETSQTSGVHCVRTFASCWLQV